MHGFWPLLPLGKWPSCWYYFGKGMTACVSCFRIWEMSTWPQTQAILTDVRLECFQVLLVLLKSQWVRRRVLIFTWLSVFVNPSSKDPLRKRSWKKKPNNNGNNMGSKALIDTWAFYAALTKFHRLSGFKQHPCIVEASPKQKFWPSVA